MKTKTQRLVISALLCALTCVVTMMVKVPSPFKGYLNLGDGIVLFSSFMLEPGYAFLAAGIGSALADLFSGYALYAPATFVIKGVMALIAFYDYKIMNKKMGDFPSRLLSCACAELVMVGGYLLFEGILYGFAPSLVNVLPNAVQGAVGMILAIILMKIFSKSKIRL